MRGMRGNIVIGNSPGRTLRKGPAAIHALDVLDCAGRFKAGDDVYISFRTLDGSQYVIATGVAQCDATTLHETVSEPNQVTAKTRETEHSRLVVRAQDVQLLWGAASKASAR